MMDEWSMKYNLTLTLNLQTCINNITVKSSSFNKGQIANSKELIRQMDTNTM